MMPKGVSSGRPPALIVPPIDVWHSAQAPSAASCWPRAIVAAEYTDASGRTIGAIGRQGSTAAPMPTTAAHSAATPANVLRLDANGFGHLLAGGADAGFGGGSASGTGCPSRSPFKIRSGVNGSSRKRTPVASKIAFAIAAALGTEADSPTPSGGWSGRGTISTSILGISGNLMMG